MALKSPSNVSGTGASMSRPTNTKFSFCKSLHPKAYDMVIENLHTHIEANRQALEDKLFKNETNMLETVLNNL